MCLTVGVPKPWFQGLGEIHNKLLEEKGQSGNPNNGYYCKGFLIISIGSIK